MKVRQVYNKVFEGIEPSVENLIFVDYEDLRGYIHYQFCCDMLKTNHKMTKIELYEDYKPIPFQKLED